VASGQVKGNVKQQPPLLIHQCCLLSLSLHLHIGEANRTPLMPCISGGYVV